MRTPDPGPVFSATFTPERQAILLAALQRGYRTAQEHHDPDRGGNESTFGYSLYHFNVHELTQAAASNPSLGMEVVFENQAFRLRAGKYLVACHRVGQFATDDIWTRFPENNGAAHRLVRRQGWLPGMEPRIDAARSIVLAHLGNTDTGLEALHLCIPVAEDESRITEWGFAQEVWRIGASSAAGSRADAPQVPDETVQSPVVRRKAKETGA